VKLLKRDLEAIITKEGYAFPKPRNIPELIKTIIANEKSSLPPPVDPITKQLKMVETGIQHYIKLYKESEAFYKQIIGEYELQEEIAELKGETPVHTPVNPAAFAALMDDMAAEDEANGIFDHLDPEERDYGLGGQEFVDPTSGKDTWHS
jgi:hypothetical protein